LGNPAANETRRKGGKPKARGQREFSQNRGRRGTLAVGEGDASKDQASGTWKKNGRFMGPQLSQQRKKKKNANDGSEGATGGGGDCATKKPKLLRRGEARGGESKQSMFWGKDGRRGFCRKEGKKTSCRGAQVCAEFRRSIRKKSMVG